MDELMKRLQEAINTYHPMRKAVGYGWVRLGTFLYRGTVYGFVLDDEYSREMDEEARRYVRTVVTCREISKVDNDGNMGANHWFEVRREEEGLFTVHALPKDWGVI